jgi:DeoR/GlpR family transcriptional regulator of sugar metabolism
VRVVSTFPVERKMTILEQLNVHGKVNAADLALLFDVTTETIRRDLDLLENEGLLKRVHGGAVKINFQVGEPPFVQRQQFQIEAKQKIAKKAAEFVHDGDTIVIGVGTTIMEFAKAIRGRCKLTILTNSVPTASLLMDSLNQGLFHGKVMLLGGELNSEQHSVRGSLCEKMLDLFHVDKAFISPGGLSLSGISDYDLEECLISKKMIEVSKEVMVLADQSKIGIEVFGKIAPLEKISVIICDEDVPQAWVSKLPDEVVWMAAGKEQQS